jgi:hypothetical protein
MPASGLFTSQKLEVAAELVPSIAASETGYADS